MTKPKEEKDASKGKPAPPASLPLVSLAPSRARRPSAARCLPASVPEPKPPVTSATPGEKGGDGPLGCGGRLAGWHRFPSFLVELLPRECLQPLPLPLWTHRGGAAGGRSCCSPERREQRCLRPAGRPCVRVPVCACARVCIMCAARVQHGDILRNLPRTRKPKLESTFTPLSPPPMQTKSLAETQTPSPTLLSPSHPPLPNSLPPPQKAGACNLRHAACKSEQSGCPGAARAAPRPRSLAKPRENKGCCPLATSAQWERASAGGESLLAPRSGVQHPGPGAPGRRSPRACVLAWGLPPAG